MSSYSGILKTRADSTTSAKPSRFYPAARPPATIIHHTLSHSPGSWAGPLDSTASLPKSSRFTPRLRGQRLDNRTLDALELAVRAIFSPPARERAVLEELNLLLAQLRVLWWLCQERGWISRQQLVFVVGKIDEAGRMTGGWIKQVEPRGEPHSGKP